MEFGKITIVIILTTALSGFGVAIIKWIYNKWFSKDNKPNIYSKIKQKKNMVGGDMAGGNITNDLSKKENNKQNSIQKLIIDQSDNIVCGDLATGDIEKTERVIGNVNNSKK